MGLANEYFTGSYFNFELSLQFSTNGDFQFVVKANRQGKKPNVLFLPFRALPRMREKLAKILTEQDGGQQIVPAPEIPPDLLDYLKGFNF